MAVKYLKTISKNDLGEKIKVAVDPEEVDYLLPYELELVREPIRGERVKHYYHIYGRIRGGGATGVPQKPIRISTILRMKYERTHEGIANLKRTKLPTTRIVRHGAFPVEQLTESTFNYQKKNLIPGHGHISNEGLSFQDIIDRYRSQKDNAELHNTEYPASPCSIS